MARDRRIQKAKEGGLVDAVHDLFFGKEDPDQRLLRERDDQVRGMRDHGYAFAAVNGGLVLFNLLTVVTLGISLGWMFPSVAIVLLWGIGFVMHALVHRGWMRDNADAVLAAELRLGVAPELKQLGAKAAPALSEVAVEGVPITDPRWQRLLAKARRAVEEGKRGLDGVKAGVGAVEADAQLRRGLADLERLCAGAERMRQAVSEISPGGAAALKEELAELDERIQAAQDERLRAVLIANRAHLLARRAKVEAVTAETERMLASGEGFLLAADNMRLDAARLDVGQLTTVRAGLDGPTERLAEEVAILRKVEAELERY